MALGRLSTQYALQSTICRFLSIHMHQDATQLVVDAAFVTFDCLQVSIIYSDCEKLTFALRFTFEYSPQPCVKTFILAITRFIRSFPLVCHYMYPAYIIPSAYRLFCFHPLWQLKPPHSVRRRLSSLTENVCRWTQTCHPTPYLSTRW